MSDKLAARMARSTQGFLHAMAKPVLASVMQRPKLESVVEVPLTPEANDLHAGERLAEHQALLDATPRRGGVGGVAALDGVRGVLEVTLEADDAHFGDCLAAGEAITPCEEHQALLDATPRRGGVGGDASLDGARGVLEAAASSRSTVPRKPRGAHGVLDTRFMAVSLKFPSPWKRWFSYVKAFSSQVCSFELVRETMNCPDASLLIINNGGSMLRTKAPDTNLCSFPGLARACCGEREGMVDFHAGRIGLVSAEPHDRPHRIRRPLCTPLLSHTRTGLWSALK